MRSVSACTDAEDGTVLFSKTKKGGEWMALRARVRDHDGNWNVPNANWDGSKWNRNANWFTNDWNADYRVVLLDTQDKVPAERTALADRSAVLFSALTFQP